MYSKKYDIIVAGGGFAGTAAAVCAARRGQRVLLLERSNSLGGAASNCLVHPFMLYFTNIDGKRRDLCGGFFAEIVQALKKHGKYQCIGPDTYFHGEVLKLILNRICIAAGVELLFHARITDAAAEDNLVRSVRVSTDSGDIDFEAKYFIDATGDANLSYMCGFPYHVGRSGDGLCQPMTLCFRLANVDMTRFDAAAINKLYAEKRAAGEIKNPREDVLTFRTLTDGVLHFNTTRIVKRNPLDVFDVTLAEIEAREQVFEIFDFLKANFDCFKDSDIIMTAPQIGVRESRMIDGEYILTGDDLKRLTVFPDAVATGNYDLDIHNPEGTGTSHYYFKSGEFYTIPYRSLIPRGAKNLLVGGRCIGCDHEAQAAIRIMPIVSCTGEACGVAAALAAENDCEIGRVDTTRLRAELVGEGAIIGGINI